MKDDKDIISIFEKYSGKTCEDKLGGKSGGLLQAYGCLSSIKQVDVEFP